MSRTLKNSAALTVPDADLGPYMLALSPQHRRCVVEYWETNGNKTEAVRRAGFSDVGDSAKTTAYRIFHREDVQLAIHEEEAKHIRLAAGRAIHYVEQVVDDTKVKPEIRLKAAFDLMNRAGHSAVMQSHLTVEHTLNEDQLDARILAICAELGLSRNEAQKLLIDQSNIVDGIFEEVPRELTPEEIAAQAERERESGRRRELAAMTPEQRDAAKAAITNSRRTFTFVVSVDAGYRGPKPPLALSAA